MTLLLSEENILRGNGVDVGDGRLEDELAEIDATNRIKETEVESAGNGKVGQVASGENTLKLEVVDELEVGNLSNHVNVEDIGLEDAVESTNVEALAEKAGEKRVEALLETEAVDRSKVAERVKVEDTTVDPEEIVGAQERALLNRGGSRSGGGNGSESSDDDLGELHLEGW